MFEVAWISLIWADRFDIVKYLLCATLFDAPPRLVHGVAVKCSVGAAVAPPRGQMEKKGYAITGILPSTVCHAAAAPFCFYPLLRFHCPLHWITLSHRKDTYLCICTNTHTRTPRSDSQLPPSFPLGAVTQGERRKRRLGRSRIQCCVKWTEHSSVMMSSLAFSALRR